MKAGGDRMTVLTCWALVGGRGCRHSSCTKEQNRSSAKGKSVHPAIQCALITKGYNVCLFRRTWEGE
eukprot:6052104-Pyramimonas_sp.AAC.1